MARMKAAHGHKETAPSAIILLGFGGPDPPARGKADPRAITLHPTRGRAGAGRVGTLRPGSAFDSGQREYANDCDTVVRDALSALAPKQTIRGVAGRRAHYGFPCGDFQGVPAVDGEDYRRLIAQRLPVYSANKEDSRMTRSLELCTSVSHIARSISCGSLELPAPLTHEVNF